MLHYRKMRSHLLPAGVSDAIGEIVLSMQFAVKGHEVPFKVHALRAISLGLSKGQLEALLMTGFGVTLIACEAAQALAWLDEACTADQAAMRAPG